VDVFLSHTLDEALAIKARRPDAVPIAGGTDLMVDLNFDRRRPPALLDVSQLAELRAWRRDAGQVLLGAGMTYTQIIALCGTCPPLVQAARTVGSPQIRNRGTVGGNIGTASPAGDLLPVLAAHDAEVLIATVRERRAVPWPEFFTGPKRTTLPPDGVILGVRWLPVRGVGTFAKVGPRNAMVIAVASLCLVLDEGHRRVRVALGSVGPTVLRAPDAEAYATAVLARAGAWDDPAVLPAASEVEAFAERVAAAARPIDDVRGTAAYRRHACAVLARRALRWTLDDRRGRVQGTRGGGGGSAGPAAPDSRGPGGGG